MTEWIKIKDKKPPQNVHVLVSVYDGRPGVCMSFTQIASRFGERWFDDKHDDEICKKHGIVTHWMPLPDDPAPDTISS